MVFVYSACHEISPKICSGNETPRCFFSLFLIYTTQKCVVSSKIVCILARALFPSAWISDTLSRHHESIVFRSGCSVLNVVAVILWIRLSPNKFNPFILHKTHTLSSLSGTRPVARRNAPLYLSHQAGMNHIVADRQLYLQPNHIKADANFVQLNLIVN